MPRIGLFSGKGAGSQHDVQLDAGSRWAVALSRLRSQMAVGVPVRNDPPGWYAANVPASGNWIPVNVAYFRSTTEINQRKLPPIGPTNEDPQRAQAMRAAIVAGLRQMGG